MAESPLHRHDEWKAETAELHQLLATAQQRLSISPRGAGSPVDGTPERSARSDAPHSFSPTMDAPAVQPSFQSFSLPTERGMSAAPAPASTFVEDMRGALKRAELCDAVLVAKGGKEVFGVRAVLACRSTHLEKLLLDASPSSGARTEIQMPEHSHAALQAVVTYLVTDELVVLEQESDDEAAGRSQWATWVEIVSIAVQWQLARMENLALEKIIGSIDEINCVEILIEATQFNLEALKKDCIDYIVGHKEEVRKQRSWQELIKHPDILLEVSTAL